jgi:hypothetical protein
VLRDIDNVCQHIVIAAGQAQPAAHPNHPTEIRP